MDEWELTGILKNGFQVAILLSKPINTIIAFTNRSNESTKSIWGLSTGHSSRGINVCDIDLNGSVIFSSDQPISGRAKKRELNPKPKRSRKYLPLPRNVHVNNFTFIVLHFFLFKFAFFQYESCGDWVLGRRRRIFEDAFTLGEIGRHWCGWVAIRCSSWGELAKLPTAPVD